MTFTYDGYRQLIDLIQECEYTICSYRNYESAERCTILRHDVDYDIGKAVAFAKTESSLGIRSTYFVLLTGDFYNLFSKRSTLALKAISSYGHDIGLHFDTERYPDIQEPEQYLERIQEEARVLSYLLGKEISAFSMHRPNKQFVEANLRIEGIANTYGDLFFRQFKYLSDSRKCWREPVEEIIKSGEFKRLQILTHPIWYDEVEKDLRQSVEVFVNNGNRERYQQLENNFTNLSEVMGMDEV